MIGLSSFQDDPPFDASLMTHFRKRLGPDVLSQVNEWIIMDETKPDDDDEGPDAPSGGATENDVQTADESSDHVPRKGKLLLDATCAPADISYPTDLSLLNEAREKLEHIIDVLHAPHQGKLDKPRTYREKARKNYLAIAKQRWSSQKKIRKGIGQQLRYVARDLRVIQRLIGHTPLTVLSPRCDKIS